MPRGLFVTFEGIDGAGKTSHLRWIPDWLRARAIDPLVTREPGGTALGERLRALLLAEPMHLDTEALLMFAARREHLAQVIEPALSAGRMVLCDRFTDATFAYQGGGRGLAVERLDALERWVNPHLRPDRTFLFDLPVRVAAQRRAAAREADRFEREDEAFFERVRSAYLARVAAAPERFCVLDAREPIDAIRQRLEHALNDLVPSRRHDGARTAQGGRQVRPE